MNALKQIAHRHCSSRLAGLIGLILLVGLVDLVVILQVPFLQQIGGFLFLGFLPGWLILRLLRFNDLSISETLVFSLGLSLALVLIFGLIFNESLPLLGYSTPLYKVPLRLAFNLVILALTAAVYFSGRDWGIKKLLSSRLTTTEKLYWLIPALFPLISFLGMRRMNLTGDDSIIAGLLLAAAVYVVFLTIRQRRVPDSVYPPIILFISVSLVLLMGLRSNHVIGSDIHRELYFFQQTAQNGFWQIISSDLLGSCLSISILPTIFQAFLSINDEFLFKILFPLLFSFSPLVVYLISKRYLNSIMSFLAAFFFMSQYYFLKAEYSPRTVTAILFFSLAILALFHRQFGHIQKYTLFFLFAASAIVSHYSTSYIFLLVMLITWLMMKGVRALARRIRVISSERPDRWQRVLSRVIFDQDRQPVLITFLIPLVLFIAIYLWNAQITLSGFDTGIRFVTNSLKSLQDIFNAESRGASAGTFGAGLTTKTIPQQIEFVFSWATIALIAIGVTVSLISTHWRRKNPENGGRPGGQESNPQYEFLLLSLACAMVLAASIALPYVFIGYDMARTYTQAAVVLSPLFVLGGLWAARSVRRVPAPLILLVVLIPYFLCISGVMYQPFKVPKSIMLNSSGQDYDMMYIHEQESAAARWLAARRDKSTIYSDYYGTARLQSQAGIRNAVFPVLVFDEHKFPQFEGYFYLRYTGAVDGKLMDKETRWHEMEEFDFYFSTQNVIYSNGGSAVYR